MRNYKRNVECKKPQLQSISAQQQRSGKGEGREEKEAVVLANPKVTTKMQVSAPN